MEPAPPNPDVPTVQAMLPEVPMLKTASLRMADRQLQQLLYKIMQHRQRQVSFTQRQAAAAAQATLQLPQDAAQLLQQGGFEQHWGQLDAAWQQARASEREAWMQMRAQQRQELMQIWEEQEAAFQQHMLEHERRWQLRKPRLQEVWDAAAQAERQRGAGEAAVGGAAVAGAGEPQQQAPQPADSVDQPLPRQRGEVVEQVAVQQTAGSVGPNRQQGPGCEPAPLQAAQQPPQQQLPAAVRAPMAAQVPPRAEQAEQAQRTQQPEQHEQWQAAGPTRQLVGAQRQPAAERKRKQPEAADSRGSSAEPSSGRQWVSAAVLDGLAAYGGAATLPPAPGTEATTWLLPLASLPLASLGPPPLSSPDTADASLLAALLTAAGLPQAQQAQQAWGASAFQPVAAPRLPQQRPMASALTADAVAAAAAAAAAVWPPMRFN